MINNEKKVNFKGRGSPPPLKFTTVSEESSTVF